MKISVVVLTKNEEDKIEKCLESVSWAEEVVVIDDYSEDETREIARKMGAKVYKRRLESDFAKQRNCGLEKAKNEWVLFVDADEVVSAALAAEVQSSKFKVQNRNGFKIRRVDYLWGRELKYGDVRNLKIIRLGKKSAGRWKRPVHEYWDIPSTSSGQVGEFQNPLLHYPHRNVAQFLENIRKYSLIHAKVLEKEGVKVNLLQIVARPVAKFLVNYVVKLGFLDGTAGFVHAMLMSLHSFLARSQLWLWQRKNT